MTDGGDITLNVEAYDGMYDPSIGAMILHTWKKHIYFLMEIHIRNMGQQKYLSRNFWIIKIHKN